MLAGVKKISQFFEDFVKRIILTSKLEITDGILPLSFEQELIVKKEAVTIFFKTIFSIWNKYPYSVFVSDFIYKEGLSIFSVWLAEVFPFNFDRIGIKCPKGPSTEDALLNITYIYDNTELNIIRNLIKEYDLTVNEEILAKLLLIEAIKSISRILSEAIDDDYKIFTEDVTTETINGNLIVNFKGAGRVIK